MPDRREWSLRDAVILTAWLYRNAPTAERVWMLVLYTAAALLLGVFVACVGVALVLTVAGP